MADADASGPWNDYATAPAASTDAVALPHADDPNGPWNDFAPPPLATEPADGKPLTVTPSPSKDGADSSLKDQRSGLLGTIDAGVRGVARAVPFMDDIAAAGNTAFSYLPNAVRGYIPGANPKDQGNESFGQRYHENLARERGIDASDDANHPVASYGGQLSGALLAPAGPAKLASGVASRALGAGLGTAVGSGAVGAGYGALYGAGQGESLDERLSNAKEGALFGGVTGAVAPAIIGGATNLAKAVALPYRMATNPSAIAAERIAKKLGQDADSGHPGMSASDISAAAATDQPTVLGDLGGDATRDLARSAANSSSDASAALSSATSDRFSSQNTRFTGFMKGLFSNDLDNQAVRDQIAARAKAVNGPAYQEAYAKGANGIWNDGLQQLVQAPDMKTALADATRKGANNAALNGDPVIRNPFSTDPETGAISLAKNADGSQAVPTLQYWDQVKRALDDKITSARRAGNLEDARDATQLKTALTGHLDAAVPEYANARQGAFQLFGAENALEAGENFLGMSKAADIGAVRKAFGQMPDAQKEFFAQGLASQIAQKASNAGERTNIVNLFNSPATLEKMQLGLGTDRANQIEAYLRRETSMDRLRNALGNSTTPKQLNHAGDASGHGGGHGLQSIVTGALSSPMAGAIAGGAAAYHEHGFDPEEITKYAAGGAMAGLMGRFVKNTNQGVVTRVGQMLASHDPEDIAKVTQQIGKNNDLRQAFRRAETAITSGAARLGGSQDEQAPPLNVQALPARASGGRVEPTDAQKEAGNYAKDHTRFAGLGITIENRKGTTRSGIGGDGKRWSTDLPADYGYIKGTEGADGDHVDCYVGPDEDAPYAWVINQMDLHPRRFDEHKVMLGFRSRADAIETYKRGFSDGKGAQRIGSVRTIPMSVFPKWVKSGATKKVA